MYYSYVMGIDNRIMELASQGFDIQNDGDNFMVSFPEEKSNVWEEFIRQYLELGYWNEYLTEDFFAPDYFEYLIIDDVRDIIRTKLEKPSKYKGLALI